MEGVIPFQPFRDLKTNFRFFLLPILNSSIWTTSSALLKKELQKQSGTMVRMAQGDLASPVPWAEVCVPYWQLSEHWDKGFLLHWGSAWDTCLHVQPWGDARMAGLFKVLQLKCWQQLQPSLPVFVFTPGLGWQCFPGTRKTPGCAVHSSGCWGYHQWGWIGAAWRSLTGSCPACRGSLFFAKGMFWAELQLDCSPARGQAM